MEENNTKSLEMSKLELSEMSRNSPRSINELIINEDSSDEFDLLLNSGQRGICKNINYFLRMTTPIEWLFVITFSLTLTIILSIFDEILTNSIELRYNFCTIAKAPIINFILWITSAVIFLLLATSSGYFISQEADGSGIPEVKTVLSGFYIYRYFSLETFIAKILGLYFAIVGGKNNFFKTAKALLVEKLVHLCIYLVFYVIDY